MCSYIRIEQTARKHRQIESTKMVAHAERKLPVTNKRRIKLQKIFNNLPRVVSCDVQCKDIKTAAGEKIEEASSAEGHTGLRSAQLHYWKVPLRFWCQVTQLWPQPSLNRLTNPTPDACSNNNRLCANPVLWENFPLENEATPEECSLFERFARQNSVSRSQETRRHLNCKQQTKKFHSAAVLTPWTYLPTKAIFSWCRKTSLSTKPYFEMINNFLSEFFLPSARGGPLA